MAKSSRTESGDRVKRLVLSFYFEWSGKNLCYKIAFRQKHEGSKEESHVIILGKSIPSRGNKM